MLRTAAGMRQRDVAERLGVGASSVARLEAEEVNPRLTTLLRYLDAIGCTLDDFARALRVPDGDAPAPAAGSASEDPAGDLGWLVRELLELRREQAALAREFERFREAVTLTVLDVGGERESRTASDAEDSNGRRPADD